MHFRYRHAGLLAAAFLPAMQAMAADATPVQEARRARTAAASQRNPQSRPTLAVQVGVAHDQDEAGAKGWTTPFDLNWTAAATPWGVELSGDGYSRQRDAEGTRAQGLADLVAAAWWIPVQGVTTSIEFTLPTHGEVGSSASAQTLRLQYDTPISNAGWSATLQGAVSRDNAPAEGASRYGQTLMGLLGKALGGDVTASFSVTRSWQGGAPGTTDLGGALEFPLARKTATLSLARGISAGARHTALQFDLKF